MGFTQHKYDNTVMRLGVNFRDILSSVAEWMIYYTLYTCNTLSLDWNIDIHFNEVGWI